MDIRVDEVGGPRKVLRFDVVGGQTQLQTVALHRGYVAIFGRESIGSVGSRSSHKVVVVTFIPVYREVNAVFQETNVHA